MKTCPIHLVPIEPITSADTPDRLHDFAECISTELARIPEMVAASRTRPLSGLERHLFARLEGRKDPEGFLSRLEWQTAVDACQIMGAVFLYGRDVPLLEVSDDEWHLAGDAGFAIIEDGEHGIVELLEHLDETYEKTRFATEGPQAVYGKIFRWLDGGSDDRHGLDPIIDIMRRHVLHTTPVGPDDTMLGKTFGMRVLHSVPSAALEYDIHPKRLRKILEAGNVIAVGGTEPDERTVFDAAVADRILANSADSLSMTEAETYLNAGRVQTKLLKEAGFIVPFVSIARKKIVRNDKEISRGEYNFSRSALDAFLKNLLQDAVELDDVSDDICTIPITAKKVNRGAAEIVRPILERRLAFVGRRRGEQGYLSIVVSVDELKTLLHGSRPEGLTARQIEKVLVTSTDVVRELIDRGYLPTHTVTNPINRCPLTLTAKADLDAFRATYVSLTEYAAHLGQHIRTVQKMLTLRGIEPAMTREMVNATFYRRSTLP